MKKGKTMTGGKTCPWPLPVLLSYLTVLALTVRLAKQDMSENWVKSLLTAFGGFSVSQLFLFAGLCCFYRYALGYIAKARWTGRDKACVLVPAGLFAAFMVVGCSFEAEGSLELVLGNSLQIVKCLVAWNGYFIAFSVAIAALYTWLPNVRLWRENKGEVPGKGLWGRYLRTLRAHPFRTAFVTLLICYLPCMVLSYPGILMGDGLPMILQVFNLPEWTSNSIVLLDETVRLNGHHPVAYTMLLHLGLMVGKGLFGSYNVGLFLVALLQALAQFAVMSAVIAQLIRLKLRPGVAAGLLAYFAFAPRIQNYTFLVTKDVLAAAALLLFLLFVFRVLAELGGEVQNMAGCAISGVAMCLFRNEGKYIILASLVFMLFLTPKKRRQLAVSCGTALLAAVLFFNVLMPALHITPGSVREMLSVPFQQTARYVRDHGQEVTEEERVAIAAVLDYDSLAKWYDPDISDPVKSSYRKTATTGELVAYFKAWFQMGLKHPGTYVQATINNYYNYFYPGHALANVYDYNWSEDVMEQVDDGMAKVGIQMDLHHPAALAPWRQGYETLREKTFGLPVLSILKSSAAYVWALILLVFYSIKRRNAYAFALLLPLLFILGVCLLGPVNGTYFRYLYGISISLPAVFFFGAYWKRRDSAAAL